MTSQTQAERKRETMSERHATSLYADPADHGGAGLRPHFLIDNNAELQERIGEYRARMSAAIDAHEALLRGLGGASQKSLDMIQAMAAAAREDFIRTLNASEPTSSMRIQFDAYYDRGRELLDGIRSVADEIYECWFAAVDAAWSSATTAPPSRVSEYGPVLPTGATAVTPSLLPEAAVETEKAGQNRSARGIALNDGGTEARRRA